MGSRPHKGDTVMLLCRPWCGPPDEFRELDSYLFYISQLIYHGSYDGTSYSAASETAGGGMPSQTSVDNFNYFLATANSCSNSIFRKFNNVVVERNIRISRILK